LEKEKGAFLNCCYFGDPGKNVCWNAGRVSEEQGNFQQAIEYYRLSRWEMALERAKVLEE
jgi:hypothetical protein